MKGHRRFPVIYNYPGYRYGYGYGYDPYYDYYRRPPADPQFVVVEEGKDSKTKDFLEKINWPTVAATLVVNAVLLASLGRRR